MKIVDRLRMGGPNAGEVGPQAADLIERLREGLQSIEMGNWFCIHDEGFDPKLRMGPDDIARTLLKEIDNEAGGS